MYIPNSLPSPDQTPQKQKFNYQPTFSKNSHNPIPNKDNQISKTKNSRAIKFFYRKDLIRKKVMKDYEDKFLFRGTEVNLSERDVEFLRSEGEDYVLKK